MMKVKGFVNFDKDELLDKVSLEEPESALVAEEIEEEFDEDRE
jgi:hypothetical protein